MRNSMIRLIAVILAFNTYLYLPASAQTVFGFKMPEKTRSVDIPFEQHNNLIVIPVTINHLLTLKFVVDTGAENAILTEKIYGDLLRLNYTREIAIDGPGLIDSVKAFVANSVTFELPGGIIGQQMNMLVLKEDYLKLSESLGENVYGIIGYDIFSRFVVKINYDQNILTLYDPKKYKKKKSAIEIPLDIRGSKPFINSSITQKGKKVSLNVMIDTGASHAALIDFHHLDGVSLPTKTIKTRLGRGIGGDIPGHLGRIDLVEIDTFNFSEVLVSAPFDGAYNKLIKRGARIGTFGGELLTRFNITFDYQKNKAYLKRSNRYKDSFDYDMSGMTLNAVGLNLDTLKVVNIQKGSPAYQADIRKGDIIKSINGKTLKFYSLSFFYEMLQMKDRKKIKCVLYRKGKKEKMMFRLKRII